MSADAEVHLPGSDGEHALQQRLGSTDRARSFYDRQVLDHLNPQMREFVLRQEMVFISTADRSGNCDTSFRAGEPGFVQVLDERTLVYPEYRGNGVYASLGNMMENPHIGLLFVDFFRDVIGLHVNGAAAMIEHEDVLADERITPRVLEELERSGARRPERWVKVNVDEAYIHCSKHIPLLAKLDKQIHWGTDDYKRKGGDFFGVAAERKGQDGPHHQSAAPIEAPCGASYSASPEERYAFTPDEVYVVPRETGFALSLSRSGDDGVDRGDGHRTHP